MAHGVGTDGDQRIGGKPGQFLPAHAQGTALGGGIDAAMSGDGADRLLHLGFVPHAAQPVVERLVSLGLGLRRAAIEVAKAAVHVDVEPVVLGHGLAQHFPPQNAGAFGKRRSDIERYRYRVPLQDRPGMVEHIAVAIVEGDGDEAALGRPTVEPPPRLVHGDDVDTGALERVEHRIEKVRRDFQAAERLERLVMGRQDAMEGEDGAEPGKERPRQPMRAGEIKGVETGSDGPLSHDRHDTLLMLAATPAAVFTFGKQALRPPSNRATP